VALCLWTASGEQLHCREFNRAHHFSQMPAGINFGRKMAFALRKNRSPGEEMELLSEASVGRISRQGDDNTGRLQGAFTTSISVASIRNEGARCSRMI